MGIHGHASDWGTGLGTQSAEATVSLERPSKDHPGDGQSKLHLGTNADEQLLSSSDSANIGPASSACGGSAAGEAVVISREGSMLVGQARRSASIKLAEVAANAAMAQSAQSQDFLHTVRELEKEALPVGFHPFDLWAL